MKLPIPQECIHCQEDSCYNCDTAGKRWPPTPEEELLLRRRLAIQGIRRLLRQIAELDQQLQAMDTQNQK